MCRAVLRRGVSADTPDRPGVAALVEELEVRRHVRRGLVAGAVVAAVVFLAFAYLPGTDESLLFWAALAFVLASAVAGLVTTVLVAMAAYRRTRSVHDVDESGRSPATLAVVVGVLGWVLSPVVAALVLERPSAGVRLLVALATSGFVALAVGGLGVRVAVALSGRHEWRPRAAAAGAVAYTVLVAAPAAGCPSGAPCLDTPDHLVAALVGLDPGAVAAAYVVAIAVGGLSIGGALGLRGAGAPHGFGAGVVAAIAVLPVVAAAAGDPSVVRTTALALPVLLGAIGAIGGAAAVAVGFREGSPER